MQTEQKVFMKEFRDKGTAGQTGGSVEVRTWQDLVCKVVRRRNTTLLTIYARSMINGRLTALLNERN